MTSNDEQRAKKDAVTIGQIRKRIERHLESQIGKLNAMIRKGYHQYHHAEAYLKKDILETLTKLQNVDSLASTEVLFPTKETP
jgi:DNA helicase IV